MLRGEMTLAEVARELGVTEQTYYRWRREYGGMKVSQARLVLRIAESICWMAMIAASQAAPWHASSQPNLTGVGRTPSYSNA